MVREGGPSQEEMGLKPEETPSEVAEGQAVLDRLKARVADQERKNPRKKPVAGDEVGPLYMAEDFKAYTDLANRRLDDLRKRDWNLDKKFQRSPEAQAARSAAENVDRLTRANYQSFKDTRIYPDDTQVENAYKEAMKLYEKLK